MAWIYHLELHIIFNNLKTRTMKKMTSIIDKLAGYQIDADDTKNIKGGNNDLSTLIGIGWGGGDPPPFG
jgi:hypothetical protein